MKILDFRYRPPYKSFLDTIMYRELDRAAACSARFGSYQPEAVAARDFKQSLKELEEAGIGRAVIAGRKVLPFIGVVDNQDIVELERMYPERFLGLAGIDPSDMGQAMEEYDRYITEERLHGIVLEPGLLERPMFVDDDRLFPLYERCEKERIPVMMMVGSNCGPDIEYSHPVHPEHVAKAFPGLKMVMAHGGWPWVTQMIQVAYRYKNLYLLPDLYLFRTPGANEYLEAANYILQDQMLFGSAYPYMPLKEAVGYFMDGRLRQEVLEKFMYKNAMNVFEDQSILT